MKNLKIKITFDICSFSAIKSTVQSCWTINFYNYYHTYYNGNHSFHHLRNTVSNSLSHMNSQCQLCCLFFQANPCWQCSSSVLWTVTFELPCVYTLWISWRSFILESWKSNSLYHFYDCIFLFVHVCFHIFVSGKFNHCQPIGS